MKETSAIIGGEGNGGIIYPTLHYGRDALVGIALFLTYLSEKDLSVSELRSSYPNYFISKNKIELTDSTDMQFIISELANKYSKEKINLIDGLKIDFDEGWVHLRKSNTEPIVRIYSESISKQKADKLASVFVEEIKSLI
jgi:phosphomannomutase